MIIKIVARRLGQHDVDNIDYTPATLIDFVNFPAALNAFTIAT